MSSKTIVPVIAITLLSSLAIGSVGFAEDALPAHPSNQSRDMTGGTNPSSQGAGMMGDTSNMTAMMNQMTRMMENCNRLMETAAEKPSAPEKPPVPETPRG